MARVTMAVASPATIPTRDVAVTTCPAAPTETPRSAAIGVSRLAGRNSAVTWLNAPSIKETTAAHARCSRSIGLLEKHRQQVRHWRNRA